MKGMTTLGMKDAVYDYGSHIVATFQPTRTDDLRDGASDFIGARGDYHFAGVQDEGAYSGQRIWMPDRGVLPDGIAWVPECDLQDIRLIEA